MCVKEKTIRLSIRLCLEKKKTTLPFSCCGKASCRSWIEANSICFRRGLFFGDLKAWFVHQISGGPLATARSGSLLNTKGNDPHDYGVSSGRARGAGNRCPGWDWEAGTAGRRLAQSRDGPRTRRSHHGGFVRLSPPSSPESPAYFTARFFHFSSCTARLTMNTFLLNPWPPTQKERGSSHETKGGVFFFNMKEPDIYSS